MRRGQRQGEKLDLVLPGVHLCWALPRADQLTTALMFLPKPQHGSLLGWIIGALQDPAQPEWCLAAVPPPAAPGGLNLLQSGGLAQMASVSCSHSLRGE